MKQHIPTWVVATDGSVDHHCRLGAWGFHADGVTNVAVGMCTSSTTAEVNAVALALESAPDGHVVQLLVDHRPLVDGLRCLFATGRLPTWPALRSDRVLRDGFRRIERASRNRPVTVNWVKAHASNQRNRTVDIAVRAALRTSRAAA